MMAALDKSSKDYQNQVKDFQNKALELTQQHETNLAQIRSRAAIDADAESLRNLEQTEREKIDATQKGGAARLAAINDAIKEEEKRNLQDTSFYRDLLRQRVDFIRQSAEDEAKEREQAGKQESKAS